MEPAMIGVLVTVVINLLLVAFCGGKLWQKASDNARRLDRIENKLNGYTPGRRRVKA